MLDQRRHVREAELAFLNAPFVENGWALALDRLSTLTRTRLVQMIGVGGPLTLAMNLLTDQPHDPNGHLQNAELYGPENWRINTSWGPMTLQHEPHYRAYRESTPSAKYDDAVNDLDLPHGCQSALMMEEDMLIGLSLLRSSREGPCDADVLDQFCLLSRQAQRAVRVQLALGQEAAETMLAGQPGGNEITVLLDRYGHLLSMTDAAEALFNCPIGLRLDGLTLRLTDPAEDRSLKAAMRRLLASDRLTGPVVHECRAGRCASNPEGWWQLLLTRLPADTSSLGFEAHLAVTMRPVPAS